MSRGLSVATFVIGIMCIFCGIAATVFGAIGMQKVKSK